MEAKRIIIRKRRKKSRETNKPFVVTYTKCVSATRDPLLAYIISTASISLAFISLCFPPFRGTRKCEEDTFLLFLCIGKGNSMHF